MSACVCCQTRRITDRSTCTCTPTCRRHAPLCRGHCDCGPPDDDRHPYDLLDDPDGPFGDLPPIRRAG